MKSVLKVASVTVAVLFALGVMISTVDLFFGSSKIRPLFGMSADALAGDGGVHRRAATDGGASRY